MRFIYSLGFALYLPIILLRLLWRSRKNPAYRQRLAERFSLAPIHQKPYGIWIHAVSLGECVAITPLVKAIQQRYPDLPITMTAMTITGSAQIKKAFADSVYHCYVPYDFYWMQHRLLKALSPRLVLLVETELWPNLLAACQRCSVPVMLANGRLSEPSMRGYQRIAPLARAMLHSIDTLAVQEPDHKTRFQKLGALAQSVHVTGSLKFDVTLASTVLDTGCQLRQQLGATRPVWIAASTHEGEEKRLLQIHQQLLTRLPNVLMILVPRHPERFQRVVQYVQQADLTLVQYSQRQHWTTEQLNTTNVLVGNVMGQLLMLYASADVAFVGGSLIQHGGHNPLEPALVGLPIVVGKYMFNFADITQKLLDANGLQQFSDDDTLQNTLQEWLADPILAKKIGNNAQATIDENRGVLNNHLALIDKLLQHKTIPAE